MLFSSSLFLILSTAESAVTVMITESHVNDMYIHVHAFKIILCSSTDPGQATGKLYHLQLGVECTSFVIYKAGREPTPYW
jgi:hypothetical protein